MASPQAFAAAVPHVLASVSDPGVRGDIKRFAAWLKSKLRDANPSTVSSR